MSCLSRLTDIRTLSLLLMLAVFPVQQGLSQEKAATGPDREQMISAAREIMKAAHICALITLDENGQPQARAMDPFAPEDDMVVWLGTNPKTRKVRHIRNDPRVTLFYFDPEGGSYVSLVGTARLVNDKNEKARRWKEEWNSFYTNREDNYLLIAVTPERLELVSIAHGIDGDSETWTTPSLTFTAADSKKQK